MVEDKIKKMTTVAPRQLLDALAHYWQGYASAEEAETLYPRSWTKKTIDRGMVRRALALLDAHIIFENNQKRYSKEYIQSGDAIYFSEVLYWKGLRLFLIGFNGEDDGTIAQGFFKTITDALRSNLVVCLMPGYIQPWQDFAQLHKSDPNLVTIYPIDVDAIARGKLSLADLLKYKLYRRLLHDQLDNETQYSDATYPLAETANNSQEFSAFVDLDLAIEQHGDTALNWAEHPKLDSLVLTLRENKNCILIGQSSSGKTTLAFQVGKRMGGIGYRVKYIDAGSVPPQSVLESLDFLLDLASDAPKSLLIIDDLQSNPPVSKYLLSMNSLIKLAGGNEKLVVLGVSWPNYGYQVIDEFPSWGRFFVIPTDVYRVLLASYKNFNITPDVELVSSLAGDDLYILRIILDTPSLQKISSNRKSIAQEIWQRKLQNYHGDIEIAKRVILLSAMLGRYELELSEGFIEYQAGASRSEIGLLCNSRFLRRNGNRLVLGHRTLCSLLADLLMEEQDIWEYFRKNNKPHTLVDIFHEYIKSVDTSEVWTILKALQVNVGFKRTDELSDRAQVLLDAWKSIDFLVHQTEKQQKIDPTWGLTLSSANFAIEALSSIGKKDKARSSVDFMRSYWGVKDGFVKILDGTSERADFDRILSCMLDEDSSSPELHSIKASQIDPVKFHRTWVSGIILCSESAYKERTPNELERLAVLVERLQENSGNFYPARVPWCTARVLIGLARCGRNYSNSDVVRQACDWLLKPATDGGAYHDGYWISGTGIWNTPLETTAMCIIALIMAGIPSTDPRLVKAWKFVLSKRNEWVEPQREIDGVLALNAHVAMTGDWQDVSKEVNFLLQWARGEAFWDSATKTAKESFVQSLKVAFITATLIDIVWTTLRYSIKLFLDALDVPQGIISREISGVDNKRLSTTKANNMIKILFLAADPTDASRLRLGQEHREIQEKLKMASLRDQFILEQRLSVRPQDISQGLLDVEPQIVHFSGHGNSAGSLCFEDALGKSHPVSPTALASLFEQFESHVSCVVLNACYSEAQAIEISKHVKYVIGMKHSIRDDAAIAFTTGFYQAIGKGKSVEDAFRLGIVQIQLQNIPNEHLPVLHKKDD